MVSKESLQSTHDKLKAEEMVSFNAFYELALRFARKQIGQEVGIIDPYQEERFTTFLDYLQEIDTSIYCTDGDKSLFNRKAYPESIGGIPDQLLAALVCRPNKIFNTARDPAEAFGGISSVLPLFQNTICISDIGGTIWKLSESSDQQPTVEILSSFNLEKDDLETIITALMTVVKTNPDHIFSVKFYSPGVGQIFWTNERDTGAQEHLRNAFEYASQFYCSDLPTLVELLRNNPSSKITFFGMPNEFKLPSMNTVTHSNGVIDVLAAGVSKASGLEHIDAQIMPIFDNLTCAGDSPRDREMLLKAKRALIVGDRDIDLEAFQGDVQRVADLSELGIVLLKESFEQWQQFLEKENTLQS